MPGFSPPSKYTVLIMFLKRKLKMLKNLKILKKVRKICRSAPEWMCSSLTNPTFFHQVLWKSIQVFFVSSCLQTNKHPNKPINKWTAPWRRKQTFGSWLILPMNGYWVHQTGRRGCVWPTAQHDPSDDLPVLSLHRAEKGSVTRCPRASVYPTLGGWRAWLAVSGHTAVVWRKWCSASLCMAEHWVMKRGLGERKGVCLQGRHGPRVPMQPGRLARWCRTASFLLSCHAAATLSSPPSG